MVEPRTQGARQALLALPAEGDHGGLTWLEVRPQTGRTHQLRVQLAHHGHPIYGDAKYGSVHTFDRAIALHARSADVPAPDPLRADHADGRGAAGLARPLRLPAPGGPAMSDRMLDAIRDLIQEDVGNRGLRTDPART